MKAKITSYRRSLHHQVPNQVLVSVDGVDSNEDAKKLLGKKVILNISKNKTVKGKIIATHGNNGVVKARFSKGLPGQVIGKECTVE